MRKSHSESSKKNPIQGSVEEILEGRVRLFKRGYSRFYQARARLEPDKDRQNKKNAWQFRWKTFSTKQTELAPAKDYARKRYYEMLDRQEKGEPVNFKSFKYVVEEMVKDQERRKQSSSNLKNDKHTEGYYFKGEVLKRFFWSDDNYKLNIGDITYDHLQEYMVWRRNNVQEGDRRHTTDNPISDKTIHGDFVALRQTFKVAIRKGYITRIPEMPSLRYKKTYRGWFPPPEYKLLLKAVDEQIKSYTHTKTRRGDTRLKGYAEDLKDWIIWGVHTGLRVTESLRILVKQVDIHNIKEMDKGKAYCYIYIMDDQTKTEERVAVGMVGAVRSYKRMIERHNKGPDDLLFHENPRWRFAKLLKETAGVNTPNLRYDQAGRKKDSVSLRHTYIMYRLLYGKLDPFTIARICGNSVKTIENHYSAHLRPYMKKKEILHYEQLDNDIDWSQNFIAGLRQLNPTANKTDDEESE